MTKQLNKCPGVSLKIERLISNFVVITFWGINNKCRSSVKKWSTFIFKCHPTRTCTEIEQLRNFKDSYI